MNRKQTHRVDVGGVPMGAGAPIVVQSMTNTDTADVESTARQVKSLAEAGSELVRITVNTSEAAAAILGGIACSLLVVGVAVWQKGLLAYDSRALTENVGT